MRKFKTESKKLLDLMINSIYTNKEIFLRELISNASDAVDKLYFKSLTDQTIGISKNDLEIDVDFDKESRTITISDTGIGMTKEELETNLGTIAHSGSLEFKTDNAEAQGEDLDIIGQFGVGFYSSFMVAKRVIVISRAYNSDETWVWESDGIEGYTIEAATDEQAAGLHGTHGTTIVLFLKKKTEEEAAELVETTGVNKGWTMAQVSEQRPSSLKYYAYLCEDCGNIVKAAAMLLMGGSQQLKAS